MRFVNRSWIVLQVSGKTVARRYPVKEHFLADNNMSIFHPCCLMAWKGPFNEVVILNDNVELSSRSTCRLQFIQNHLYDINILLKCVKITPPPLPRNDNQFTVSKNEREREREWADISSGSIIIPNKLNWMVTLSKYTWQISTHDISKTKKEEFLSQSLNIDPPMQF